MHLCILLLLALPATRGAARLLGQRRLLGLRARPPAQRRRGRGADCLTVCL